MPRIGAGAGIDPADRSPGGEHKPEEIVAKLRQVDKLVSQGRGASCNSKEQESEPAMDWQVADQK
jgi:hypothetical protein